MKRNRKDRFLKIVIPQELKDILSFEETPDKLTISIDAKPLFQLRELPKSGYYEFLRGEAKSFILIDAIMGWVIGHDESKYSFYFGILATQIHIFQEMIKNIFDHANYGMVTIIRGGSDTTPVFDFSIGSYAKDDPEKLARFFKALSVSETAGYFTSRFGSGSNFGLGTRMILGAIPNHALMVEKAIAGDCMWIKYSGWCASRAFFKTPVS
ncbi:MAG: hypothetical protein JWM20_429 [Patescibacteria group bacterium]|nr:hypothetical protein [Patescibacteria group bacterium]